MPHNGQPVSLRVGMKSGPIVSGLNHPNHPNHLNHPQVMMPHNGQPVSLRVGMHSGPIVSGVIGYRMPKFCLCGVSAFCTACSE